MTTTRTTPNTGNGSRSCGRSELSHLRSWTMSGWGYPACGIRHGTLAVDVDCLPACICRRLSGAPTVPRERGLSSSRPRHDVVTHYNAATQALIRRKVSASHVWQLAAAASIPHSVQSCPALPLFDMTWPTSHCRCARMMQMLSHAYRCHRRRCPSPGAALCSPTSLRRRACGPRQQTRQSLTAQPPFAAPIRHVVSSDPPAADPLSEQ